MKKSEKSGANSALFSVSTNRNSVTSHSIEFESIYLKNFQKSL